MNTAETALECRDTESREANEVLAILDTYNFAGCFDSWVISESSEKINVVINAGAKMQIHIDLLCAFARLFPVHRRGPFLGKDTLTLEFTQKDEKEHAVIHQKKRARLDVQKEAPSIKSVQENSNVAGTPGERLLSVLRDSLALFNSSLCSINLGDSGNDDEGPWCVFELRYTDRVNLLFCVHAFANAQANIIKDLWVILHPNPHILIRLFAKTDRRIVSSWEVVPIFPQKGQFTMLRHKRVVS